MPFFISKSFDLMISHRSFLFLLVVCGLLISCSSPKNLNTRRMKASPPIRVLLSENQTESVVQCESNAMLKVGETIHPVSSGETIRVRMEGSAVRVLLSKKDLGAFREPVSCYPIEVGGACSLISKRYSDTLTFAPHERNFSIHNTLSIEKYLESVVPNELGSDRKSEDFEALKAQAILARTYALAKATLPTLRSFDVFDDVRDQVFSGVGNPSSLASKAVYETKGEILSFGDQFVDALYHATCGGSTEAPQLVWNRPQGKSYLNGVRDGKNAFCQISPSYRWKESYSRERLEEIIKKNLPSANAEYYGEQFPSDWYLLDLRILKRMPSGRIAELKIIMGNRKERKSYLLYGDKIRWALRRPDGKTVLRSCLFDLTLARDENSWLTSITIAGGGNGHGVGMCQWGALGMSRKGISAGEILQHYFPGTEIQNMY